MRVLLVGAGASFSTYDVEVGYLNALKARPDVEVFEYALDQRIGLAKKWAHSVWEGRGKPQGGRPGWSDVIHKASSDALEMALYFRVDWVLIVSGMFFSLDTAILMRRAGLKTAMIATESPYADPQQARMAAHVDMCWTNERTSLGYLRQFNPRTEYLPAAYDPERHTPVAEAADVEAHDVVFVGSGFQERIDLLSAVDWDGIDLGLYGIWSLLPSRHKLRKYIRGGVTENAQTAALYRAAKIGLNLHRSSREYATDSPRIDQAASMNPRAYELAASGVFQISDYRSEVAQTFDWSVPTFTTAGDMERHVRYFLKSPAERQDKAQMAQRRIAPHTFANRADHLIADLNAIIGQPIAKGA